MPKKPLYMETTEISPAKTAAEISAVLIGAGATQIATDYDSGKVTGLRWTMPVNGLQLLFTMPARVDPIYKILLSRNRRTYLSDKEKLAMREKAERVAWRQLLRWVQAQVALIDTGMVKAHEVFFPYMELGGGTVFKMFEERGFKMLPAPAAKQ